MKSFGRVDVTTLPVPAYVSGRYNGTFTFSGSVLVTYQEAGDAGKQDFYRLAVVQAEGSGFRPIFSGEIPQKPGANGIRFMCFQDNKRILLGDYVLECMPNIDGCTQAELIPLVYPPMAKTDLPHTMHWSEIVIAPDNEHMAWTALAGMGGSVNLIGRLVRKEHTYVLEDVRTISTMDAWLPDEDYPGYSKPGMIRGGEIKQFVHGGRAISMVGMGPDTAMADSVVQNLETGDVKRVTLTPGYDETTIFSPDERLGIVMTTRFSPKTNCAILTHVPRPFARLALGNLIMPIYLYSVASVRRNGGGNIGPALVEIDRATREPDYLGENLADPEGQWFYCSPMSWHPNGRQAMWNEVKTSGEARVRIVSLPDYMPAETIPAQAVPSMIAYSHPVLEINPVPISQPPVCRVKGKVSGEFICGSASGRTTCTYEDYSDDGETILNGSESSWADGGGFVYEGQIKRVGSDPGEMDVRLRFICPQDMSGATLDTSVDAQGKPLSRGFATYGNKTLSVESML